MDDRTVRNISILDNALFNLLYIVPYFSQGIFTRRRFWFSFWAKAHPDPAGVRFISRLRRRYDSQYLGMRLPSGKSILVLDIDCVQQVLDNSPEIYAEPRVKRNGMSHFQPHALTICRGEEWRERRRFNEAVLGAASQPHPYADQFLEIIRQEVHLMQSQHGDRLVWANLQSMFEKISLQIIFGKNARSDTLLLSLLNRMMRESNRLVALGNSKYAPAFYSRIDRYLQRPQAGSLIALACQTPSTDATRVANQIPHWLFAMNETLAANVAGALALVASQPGTMSRAQQELAGEDPATVDGIENLHYLEGCLQEAMRLWPTTPLLMREATTECQVGDTVVESETQLIIHNSFNHRDGENYELADRFDPEQWPDARKDYRFNHFSHGPQACAGIGLAMFIGKAVLAALLEPDRYRLLKPALDADQPVPHSFDYFALELFRTSRQANGAAPRNTG